MLTFKKNKYRKNCKLVQITANASETMKNKERRIKIERISKMF